MPPKKVLLYTDYFSTHFNIMYDSVCTNNFDTYDNRYNLCFKDYIKGIKYNRSKRIYVNWDKQYVLWAIIDKLKMEERQRFIANARDTVILSFYELGEILPLPTSINYLINLFYRPMQPYVHELQAWFGEDNCNRRYHDLSPQRSLIFDYMSLDEYYPNYNVSKLTQTEYFWSFDFGPDADGCYTIEIRNIKKLLNRLRNKEIPFSFGWEDDIKDLEIQYNELLFV